MGKFARFSLKRIIYKLRYPGLKSKVFWGFWKGGQLPIHRK